MRETHIVAGPTGATFSIPDADRELVLGGWNTTTRMLALHAGDIATFEASQRVREPWLWSNDSA